MQTDENDRVRMDDLADLNEYLIRIGVDGGLATADGVFSAAATAPTALPPELWLPLLLHEVDPDVVAELARFERLLDRLKQRYDRVRWALSAGAIGGIVPPADNADSVMWFCRSYLWIPGLDPIWTSDQRAVFRLIPLAILAGEIPPEEIVAAHILPPGGLRPWLHEGRGVLPRFVQELFNHFHAAHTPASSFGRHSGSRRDVPCPCGSGKKPERCCLS